MSPVPRHSPAVPERLAPDELAGLMAGRAGPNWWRLGLPVLADDEITLREPRPGDEADLVAALANDEVGRFMSRPPDTIAGFSRFITWVRAERQAGRCYCYALLPHDTRRAVGLIQFRTVEPGLGVAEWGFALGPAYWGTGIFMQAARMAVDLVFRAIGVRRLEARASVVNGRGNGVLRKLGAVPEGVLRESLLQGEQRVDQVLWAMLDEDWRRATGPVAYRVELPSGASTAREAPPPRAAVARPPWCERLPVLDAPECVVREIEPADVGDLLPMLRDPEVRRYASPAPSTAEAFARFIAWSIEQRRYGRHAGFVIVPRAHGRAAGLVQLRALDPSFQTGEWGFALGRPFWGTGVFHAAARLALDFAFGPMGVHRLEARSVIANHAATHALRRLGAVFEGTLRRSFLIGGQYYDDALHSLLAAEWRRAANGSPARAPAPGGAGASR